MKWIFCKHKKAQNTWIEDFNKKQAHTHTHTAFNMEKKNTYTLLLTGHIHTLLLTLKKVTNTHTHTLLLTLEKRIHSDTAFNGPHTHTAFNIKKNALIYTLLLTFKKKAQIHTHTLN